MAVRFLSLLVVANCFTNIYGSYHWIVTENGKIETQIENSGFPLRKPFDLMGLIEQDDKMNKLKKLYKSLVDYKKSIDVQWSKIEAESDFESHLYSTDPDCLLGVRPLTQHDLSMEFVDYGNGSRPKMKPGGSLDEPNCEEVYPLDFSMVTYPHLQTLNFRHNLSLPVNPKLASGSFDVDVVKMLKENASDWSAYNLAAYYWRIVGNGTHAIECARRAVFFSPRGERHIALLNLGTLLQEMNNLAEAAIVLHAAVDHEPAQFYSHLALGTVYVSLADHMRSLVCFDNVLSLRPGLQRAVQLKHALLCHSKLETGLMDIHSSLQTILLDLQEHHALQERWLLLQNQLAVEKHSALLSHLSFSNPLPMDVRMLLKNVEDQAKMLNMEMVHKAQRAGTVATPTPRVQRNQLHTEQVFDCSVEECPQYIHLREEEQEVELLVKNKIDSLVLLMKSVESDTRFDATGLVRQLNSLLKLGEVKGYSLDQTMFLKNFESCLGGDLVNKPSDISRCFLQVFDEYSGKVNSRIATLKEKMKSLNQGSNSPAPPTYFDESSLENYLEEAEILLDGFQSAEGCKSLRDTTEL